MGPGMTAEPTTVLIADDQRVVREGLTMVLGLMPGVEIVGSARDQIPRDPGARPWRYA